MITVGKMNRVKVALAAGTTVLFAAAAIAVSQPQIAVSGMSKYSEPSFGYSFWYPLHWKVTEEPVASPDDSGWFQDGKIVKALSVTGGHNPEGGEIGLTIEEFSSTSHSITEMAAGSSPVAGNGKYYFDDTTQNWMEAALGDETEGEPPEQSPADISDRTMGGLPIFWGARRHGSESIVPLDADRFLVLTTNYVGGDTFQYVLAKTIVSAPGGATAALSAKEQIRAIHREGVLLGALAARVDDCNWYTDGKHVYDSHGDPIPGVHPSKFTPITYTSSGPDCEFGTDGKHIVTAEGAVVPGADPATFQAIGIGKAKDARHTYSWQRGQLLVDAVAVSK